MIAILVSCTLVTAVAQAQALTDAQLRARDWLDECGLALEGMLSSVSYTVTETRALVAVPSPAKAWIAAVAGGEPSVMLARNELEQLRSLGGQTRQSLQEGLARSDPLVMRRRLWISRRGWTVHESGWDGLDGATLTEARYDLLATPHFKLIHLASNRQATLLPPSAPYFLADAWFILRPMTSVMLGPDDQALAGAGDAWVAAEPGVGDPEDPLAVLRVAEGTSSRAMVLLSEWAPLPTWYAEVNRESGRFLLFELHYARFQAGPQLTQILAVQSAAGEELEVRLYTFGDWRSVEPADVLAFPVDRDCSLFDERTEQVSEHRGWSAWPSFVKMHTLPALTGAEVGAGPSVSTGERQPAGSER